MHPLHRACSAWDWQHSVLAAAPRFESYRYIRRMRAIARQLASLASQAK